MCGKICKSSGGLKNHVNKKHQESDSDMDTSDTDNDDEKVERKSTTGFGSKEITKEVVFRLLLTNCTKLVNSEIYVSIKGELSNFKEALTVEKCCRIHTVLSAEVKFKSTDSFLSTYYGHIVQNGKDMLPELKENTSKILLIKLSDTLLSKHQKK